MIFSSSLIENAVTEFARLPGVGKKTALRHVLHLLKQDPEAVKRFCDSIAAMRSEIKYCTQCFNVSDKDICKLCSDSSRKSNMVCVVENIRDVMAIEATQHFSGLYHVLGGIISPLDGIGAEQLTINALVQRIEAGNIDEVIIALSATIEGDTTSFYIQKKVSHLPVKLTTLSRGVAFGGELEYADELTLARSLTNRVPLKEVVKTSV